MELVNAMKFFKENVTQKIKVSRSSIKLWNHLTDSCPIKTTRK